MVDQDKVQQELAANIGVALELAKAGKPYEEVIRHLGTVPRHHRKELASGGNGASIEPKSRMFSEINFSVTGADKGAPARIATLEFIAVKGAFNFQHLNALSGEWRRSPPEPEECSFALAWFPSHDVRSGAPFSLYAEYAPFTTSIDPAQTPSRVFFQTADGRWD